MSAHRDPKIRIRERRRKIGVSDNPAHAPVMGEGAELPRLEPDGSPTRGPAVRADAAILRVNRQSARVRILGDVGEMTFRFGDVSKVAPGQVATLVIDRRWRRHGDVYASGKVENARIDVVRLGLVPLPLKGGQLDDVGASSEPYRRPDPYAPLWKKLTAKPRPSFEFDGIAWGVLPGLDAGENPMCDAAELVEAGDRKGANEIVMEVLGTDLRCIDAHAQLGHLVFEHSPERAIVHYEIGVRIAELSLPAGFAGLLRWVLLYNRPFLRCLHGYGLCLWRLGRRAAAQQVFERMLSLNPNDNQGVRFCRDDLRHGRSWEEMQEREEAAAAGRRSALIPRPTPRLTLVKPTLNLNGKDTSFRRDRASAARAGRGCTNTAHPS